MNKLYSIAFKRIIASLGGQEITSTNVETILNDNKIKPLGSFIYTQFPKTEFREFLKVPCPVDNVDTEESKLIIKASKALRASFHVEQRKACDQCPLKQKCPEYMKPGKQNEVNSVSDLLLFMSGMNNKSNISGKTYGYRVWSSGYKSCANIQAMLEDMKQGAPNIMEYERARVQFVANKQQEDKLAASIKGLDTLNIQQKLKNTRKEKKQRREKPQDQQSFKVERKRASKEEKSQGNQYKLFQEQQKVQFKQTNQERRGDRSDRRPDRNNRMQIEDEPRNSYRRQRQPRSSERYNNRQSYGQRRQNRYEDRGNRRSDYKGNNFNEGGRTQNRYEMRNLQGELRTRNRNQYKSQYKPRDRSDYREDRYGKDRNRQDRNRQDRSRYGNNQQREQRRPRSRQGNTESRFQSQNDKYSTNVDRKFQKAGDMYKNPKVFESWDDGSQSTGQKSFNRQETPASPKRQNFSFNFQQQQKREKTTEKTQTQEEPKIGRRIRR